MAFWYRAHRFGRRPPVQCGLEPAPRRSDPRGLVEPFGVNPAVLEAVGMGEEQLRDPAHPTSGVNRRVQLVNVGKKFCFGRRVSSSCVSDRDAGDMVGAEAYPSRVRYVEDYAVGVLVFFSASTTGYSGSCMKNSPPCCSSSARPHSRFDDKSKVMQSRPIRTALASFGPFRKCSSVKFLHFCLIARWRCRSAPLPFSAALGRRRSHRRFLPFPGREPERQYV